MLTLAEAQRLLLLAENSGQQSGWVHAVDAALKGAMRLDAELGAPVPPVQLDRRVERGGPTRWWSRRPSPAGGGLPA